MQKDKSGTYVKMFISLGSGQLASDDLDVASEFVCRMYGQHKTSNINQARYNKIVEMTGKIDEVFRA